MFVNYSNSQPKLDFPYQEQQQSSGRSTDGGKEPEKQFSQDQNTTISKALAKRDS